MKNMNEIENEKRLTSRFKDLNGNFSCHYDLNCDKCPLNNSFCHYVCSEVLADRLAKYEDIGRDCMELPEDEVVPVEVLEMSLKVSSVLANVSEHNMVAKMVLDSVFAIIDKLYGKKAGEKNDKT